MHICSTEPVHRWETEAASISLLKDALVYQMKLSCQRYQLYYTVAHFATLLGVRDQIKLERLAAEGMIFMSSNDNDQPSFSYYSLR